MLRPLGTILKQAILAVLPAACLAAPALPSENGCSNDDARPIRQAFLREINAERSSRRLAPLRLSPPLCAMAQERANEIAREGDLEFDLLPEQELLRRARRAGYEMGFLSELVLQAEGDIPSLVSSWTRQAREVSLREEIRDIGVGYGLLDDAPLYVLFFGLSAEEFFAGKSAGLEDRKRLRREMLERVNRERKKARLPILYENPLLERAAQRHAEDMLARSFYGHETPEGRTPSQRARAAGYTPRSVAENIARGQFSVGEVMDGWMGSEVHRRNILNPFFSEVGFGFAHGKNESEPAVFWVQVFGRPRR